MKKINLNQILKDIKGREILQAEQSVNTDGENEVIRFPLNLSYIFKVSLLKSGVTLTEEDTLYRMDLIDKIIEAEKDKGGVVEFTKEEVELLKELVLEAYDIYLSGSVIRILNS